MEKKKITFVYTQMVMGGAEKALIRLVRAIDKERFDVHVVLTKHGGELEDELREHVPVDYCEEITLGSSIKSGNLLGFVRGVYCRIRIRLAKTYEKKSFWSSKCISAPDSMSNDLVVAYNHFNYLSICIAARSNARSKAFWVHSMFRDDLDASMYEKALRRFDRVFCVSSDAKENFDRIFPGHAERSFVLHNIIDAEEIIGKAEEKIPATIEHPSICTVCRLSEEKGLLMVPEIVEKLIAKGRNLTWNIIGEGPLRQQLEAEIESRAVSQHLILRGGASNPYPYMKLCDIYVQPSYYEGYCTTSNEARILSKPIIATNIMGMNEQFTQGVTGILVEPNADEIYAAICELLDNCDLRERLQCNLRSVDFDNTKELELLYSLTEKANPS